MAAKVVPPSAEVAAFNCPHCGALAHQEWLLVFLRSLGDNHLPLRVPDAAIKMKELELDLDSMSDDATEDDLKKKQEFLEFLRQVQDGRLFLHRLLSRHDTLPQLVNAYVAKCFACKQFSLWAEDRMIFPVVTYFGEEPNADLSADILRDYNEARAIAVRSPRGSAALLRLAIQKLCRELGATDDRIDAAIKTLVSRGLDVQVQRALDIVRVIGNEAVHPGEMDVSDDITTVHSLFGLVNMIADKMISQPKKLEALYNALPANKLKGIAQRDKKP